jgi:hypothetical protein
MRINGLMQIGLFDCDQPDCTPDYAVSWLHCSKIRVVEKTLKNTHNQLMSKLIIRVILGHSCCAAHKAGLPARVKIYEDYKKLTCFHFMTR